MIKYIKGDLFKTDCDVIAHGCNAQGVMGAGVAKQVRQHFPRAYYLYQDFLTECQKANHPPLGLVCWDRTQKPWIANCITQEYYGTGKPYVDYKAVRECMINIDSTMSLYGLQSIAMPKIGCGLAGGSWKIIEKIIQEEIIYLVKVYEL